MSSELEEPEQRQAMANDRGFGEPRQSAGARNRFWRGVGLV